VAIGFVAACSGNPLPAAGPDPNPFPGTPATPPVTPTPPPPPSRPPDPPPVPMEPAITADPLANMTPEEINQNSPLQPVFFIYDSDQLDDTAKRVLSDNATVLSRYGGWVITIEGHCDERGTVEYNLALGERRARAASDYLVSLGVAADRLKTVSYGKEIPACTQSNEQCWAQNRRAHFAVTGKVS
jgi:peptidoglycan-associated lipoprotein